MFVTPSLSMTMDGNGKHLALVSPPVVPGDASHKAAAAVATQQGEIASLGTFATAVSLIYIHLLFPRITYICMYVCIVHCIAVHPIAVCHAVLFIGKGEHACISLVGFACVLYFFRNHSNP